MKKELYKKALKEGKQKPLAGGWSGQTFLLNYNGKKFVLRKFPDKKQADYHKKVAQALRKFKFVPKILYQNGNELLVEFITGRNCTSKDSSKVAKRVGEICAIINNLNIKSKHDLDNKFYSGLNKINKKEIIDASQYRNLSNYFEELKKKNKPLIKIDANDVYPDNFIIGNDKNLYFVDIEAIKPRPIGRGIYKAFNRWFKVDNEHELFWEGYKKYGNNKFWTEDYKKFLEIYFIVPTIGDYLDMVGKVEKRDIIILKRILKELK